MPTSNEGKYRRLHPMVLVNAVVDVACVDEVVNVVAAVCAAAVNVVAAVEAVVRHRCLVLCLQVRLRRCQIRCLLLLDLRERRPSLLAA
jgi:hypothetical protein